MNGRRGRACRVRQRVRVQRHRPKKVDAALDQRRGQEAVAISIWQARELGIAGFWLDTFRTLRGAAEVLFVTDGRSVSELSGETLGVDAKAGALQSSASGGGLPKRPSCLKSSEPIAPESASATLLAGANGKARPATRTVKSLF